MFHTSPNTGSVSLPQMDNVPHHTPRTAQKHLPSTIPRSQSNWAYVGYARTSLTHSGRHQSKLLMSWHPTIQDAPRGPMSMPQRVRAILPLHEFHKQCIQTALLSLFCLLYPSLNADGSVCRAISKGEKKVGRKGLKPEFCSQSKWLAALTKLIIRRTAFLFRERLWKTKSS